MNLFQRQKDKQKITTNQQKQPKKHKPKNPYNINISFNINNPKKVISNHINKTIKIKHYSNNQPPKTSRNNRQDKYKKFNSPAHNYSVSLDKSKQFNKYQCYLENQIPHSNKHKKDKNLYDISRKSKSDFNYNHSILGLPFTGEDPMPQLAVKKLNKMKKYFLQKIGSMDITMPLTREEHQHYHTKQTNIHNNTYNLHSNRQQNHQNRQQKQFFDISDPIKQDKDDLITQKLSQYQYQNLISFENQENNAQSIMKSKQLFDYSINDTFPQVVLDSLNSMSIKNQYLRHHTKFLSQNMKIFEDNKAPNISPKRHKNSKSKQLQLSKFLTKNINQTKHLYEKKYLNDTKSLNDTKTNQYLRLQPYLSENIKKGKRKSKVISNSTFEYNHLKSIKQQKYPTSRTLKQKIKIIHDIILKSDDSQSILSNLDKKYSRNDSDYEQKGIEKILKDQRFKKQKQNIIKTDIQLPGDKLQEIKMFQDFDRRRNYQEKSGNKKQTKYKYQDNKIETANIQNYNQFLKERQQQGNQKLTQQIINNYIDFLNEKIDYQGQICHENQQFQSFQSSKDKRSANNKQGNILDKSSDLSLIEKSVAQESQLYNSENNQSEVDSYTYGDELQKTNQQKQKPYSQQRIQRMNLQAEMKSQLAKRLINIQERASPKIITNSNSLEHSFKQNNSDLQFRKKTQIINEIHCEKSQKYQYLSQSLIQEKYINEQQQEKSKNLSKQLDSLLGFIRQNLQFKKSNKDVMSDLYNKLLNLSENQFVLQIEDFQQNQYIKKDSTLKQQKSNESSQMVSRIQQKQQKFTFIQTPQKKQPVIVKKSLKHKRNFSTQKYSYKVGQNFLQNSSELSFWDLILIEQQLNRKYNQILFQKDRKMFQIQTNYQLNQFEYDHLVNEINDWEKQAKKQILTTKKQINRSIQKFKSLLQPQNTQLSFKMKCLSQKYLPFKLKKQTRKIKNKIKETKKDLQLIKQEKRSNNELLEKYGRLISKLEINLDQVFINQNQNQRQETNNQQQKSHKLQKQHEDKKGVQYEEMKKIKLLRTDDKRSDKRRYENDKLKQQNENKSNSYSSLGSEQSDESQDYGKPKNYQYKDDQEQRQDFIDLMKIQRYQLTNFDEQQNQVQENQLPVNQNVQFSKIKQINQYQISEDDKIDICEFILLDLCIQLYQQTLDQEDNQIKDRGYYSTASNKIINCVFDFIKKEKKKPKKKGPKIGIHTELATVKQYVQKIKTEIQTLKQKNKFSTILNQELVINRLNSPIGPTAAEILKTMRFNEDQIFEFKDQQNAQQSQNDGLNSLILPIYVFTDFQDKIQGDKLFKFDKYFDDAQKQKNRMAFLKNVTHVHHKAIFDALNQMLDFQRPFGIWGKPFPWKKKSDKVHKLTGSETKRLLKGACDKVVECAMYMCGLLIDKQQSLIKNTTVSQSYIEQVKEDRMSKMIVNDFMQNEGRFYFLDDQETQIMLQTSYVIWILIMQQALQQFKCLFTRNLDKSVQI